MMIIKDADHEDALKMYIICDDDMISFICDNDGDDDDDDDDEL